eukprot:237178-Alexandrium_andersonii.AAC.1
MQHDPLPANPFRSRRDESYHYGPSVRPPLPVSAARGAVQPDSHSWGRERSEPVASDEAWGAYLA